MLISLRLSLNPILILLSASYFGVSVSASGFDCCCSVCGCSSCTGDVADVCSVASTDLFSGCDSGGKLDSCCACNCVLVGEGADGEVGDCNGDDTGGLSTSSIDLIF
jgi:hypothetical protein